MSLVNFLVKRLEDLGINPRSAQTFYENFNWKEISSKRLKISVNGYSYLVESEVSVEQCLRGGLHIHRKTIEPESAEKQFLLILFIAGIKYELPKNKIHFWTTPDGELQLSVRDNSLVFKNILQGTEFFGAGRDNFYSWLTNFLEGLLTVCPTPANIYLFLLEASRVRYVEASQHGEM